MFNAICDSLITELGNRQEKLQHVFYIFQNLFSIPHDLLSRSYLKIISEVDSNDIDGSLLYDDLKHFHEFLNILVQTDLKNTMDEEKKKKMKKNCPGRWYKLLVTNDELKETFPNLETILTIFLTIPISNASVERSFSDLNRIKTIFTRRFHKTT
jgi:hypothetical protein